jgi:CIC family chloride channel protein
MLRRSDVVRAYELALSRRSELRQRVQEARLGAATDAQVEEVAVAPGAACDGVALARVPWPRECVIASVRRGGRVMLPRGDTVLRAGDVLVVLTEGDAAASVRRLCGA